MREGFTITKSVVRELIRYDPLTGSLFWNPRARKWFSSDRVWRSWNTRFAGKRAFTAKAGVNRDDPHGAVLGVHLSAGQLIWFWMTGEWPDIVDHEDHDKDNNRWSNLRRTDQQGNLRNQRLRRTNKSGVAGVFKLRTGKFMASIYDDGKSRHLGIFDDINYAARARKYAEKRLGYHPNHGR